MQKNTKPCYYPEYLQLNKLLDAQHPESTKYGAEAHDETLFIIVHQAYELWFKQVLHEIHSILPVLSQSHVDESNISTVNLRLERIHRIQDVLVDQIDILETMTPLDFLDFRDYLIPASGFQSIQFKEIEILLGLKSEYRINFDKKSFYSRLNEKDRNYLMDLEEKPSLFDAVEKWLERMPFLEFGDFKFWNIFKDAVETMLAHDEKVLKDADYLSDAEKTFQLNDLENTHATFDALFDKEKYDELKTQGRFRMSQEATLSALFINLYREQPMLNGPFRLLQSLVEIDEKFTTWRYRHTTMVLRMIGSKIGTGGSAGHDYLRQTTQNNRFFRDLFNLTTFLIPRSALPKLPDEVIKAMNF
ncbi:tryptophan 2,3-dioxygenase family protein [Kangiella koreensis]|uniref:Tryptophan 2,3-dioxygenase n=1 Tax=Kangiella koreensis (strain DSM 16069 / JCM 12317 / KCTC 12182 / SW-125) TaxID=523791 RepID=C7RCG7_KANKD|nr:tryptophan 2,3-dioxygenase family protein [Kangiella koreensis]ACV26959.1 Tryptophan 2,3-dioxygenase [Kangiella koreensis DSM 16069]